MGDGKILAQGWKHYKPFNDQNLQFLLDLRLLFHSFTSVTREQITIVMLRYPAFTLTGFLRIVKITICLSIIIYIIMK